jgi:hypothetical protein
MLLSMAIAALALPVAGAADPGAARYLDDSDEIFWFLQISDTHVGADLGYGTQDTDSIGWVLEASDSVIVPEFIVCTGDLVDATDGWLVPSGQYQSEWDEYNGVLAGRAVTFFHDLPGNHDTYFDEGATHYLGNSLIGTAYGVWHEPWSHSFPWGGEYLFVGLNTADTTGAWAGFDQPGLVEDELGFLEESLDAWSDARLAFVFSHHPLEDLEEGADEVQASLAEGGISAWGAGHVHAYSAEQRDGTLHLVLDSAGKGDERNLGLYAVDHDGVALRAATIGSWPLTLITAPTDAALGGENPHATTVSVNHDANPVRALVFDENPPLQVYFRVDGGESVAMEELEPSIWQGVWDATGLSEGRHELAVHAVSESGSDSHVIAVNLGVTECDDGVDNDGNGYVDHDEDGGCWGPSDDDESGWSAPVDSGDPDTGPSDSGSGDTGPADSRVEPVDSAGETGDTSAREDTDAGDTGLGGVKLCGCTAGVQALPSLGLLGLLGLLLWPLRRGREG